MHFKNECVANLNKNLCNYLKGWNIKADGIYTGNHNKSNFQTVLSKNITIIQEEGVIEFSLDIRSNMGGNENINFRVNGNTQG